MQKIIYFDLDGTILNVWKRFWQVHTILAIKSNLKPIPFLKYRRLKRQGLDEYFYFKGIFSKEKYLRLKRNLLEESKFLALDSPHSQIVEVLENISKRKEIGILTHRHSRKNLLSQLKNCGIIDYFGQVINISPEKKDKVSYLKQRATIYLGDTLEDIRIAKKANVTAVSCGWGFAHPLILSKARPDYLVRYPKGLLKIIG